MEKKNKDNLMQILTKLIIFTDQPEPVWTVKRWVITHSLMWRIGLFTTVGIKQQGKRTQQYNVHWNVHWTYCQACSLWHTTS